MEQQPMPEETQAVISEINKPASKKRPEGPEQKFKIQAPITQKFYCVPLSSKEYSMPAGVKETLFELNQQKINFLKPMVEDKDLAKLPSYCKPEGEFDPN